jgi:acyl-CoA synthetase (AMP-forming)/AMP-acid ligase II
MLGYQLSIRAAHAPDDEAIVFGARRLTYAVLEQRAGRLAHALAAAGIGPGDRVAGLLVNCPQVLEALFATAMLGAIFVPLNFRLAGPEIIRLLGAVSPSLLLAGRDFDATLAALAASGDAPPHIVRVNDRPDPGPEDQAYEAWLAAHPPVPQAHVAAADDPVLLMHSSGTTGVPKCAIHTHGTVLASSMAKIIDFHLTPADRAVVFGPLFHAGPLFDLTLPLLLRGGGVVLGASRNFDAAVLIDTIARERGTVAPVYPTMLRRVMASGVSLKELRGLRLMITGGEPIAAALLGAVQQALPQAEVVNNYGSTEGGPVTTFLRAAEAPARPGSVGRPSFGVALRIVDEDGASVAAGEVGEILVRSPFTCRGYWRRPDLTAAATRDGWWRTGDLARRDAQGFVWIAGRRTDMIKTGTENVYPADVEEVIAAVPGVAEVAVIGVPDADLGEAVAAYIVPDQEHTIRAETILEACRHNLAGYKKPRHIWFVDALPRTTVNKIDRKALRARSVR